MKKIIIATALLLATSFAASAAEPAKVAVLDYRMLMQESLASKDVTAQLESLHGSYAKDIKKKEDDLRKAEEELSKGKSSMSADALAAKRKEFQQKVIDAQKSVNGKKRALDKALGESRKKLNEVITAVTQEIATSEGYDIVLANSQVIVKSDKLDITQKVLDAVNKRLPKLKVEVKE